MDKCPHKSDSIDREPPKGRTIVNNVFGSFIKDPDTYKGLMQEMNAREGSPGLAA